MPDIERIKIAEGPHEILRLFVNDVEIADPGALTCHLKVDDTTEVVEAKLRNWIKAIEAAATGA